MASNNRANASIDLALLKTYEAGSALAIDAASYAESAKVQRTACAYAPFTLKVLQAVAEGSTGYPRRFVVLGTSVPLAPRKGCAASSTSGTSCPRPDSVFELERAARGAPWKIVLEPSADSGRLVRLAADGTVVRTLPATEASFARHLPDAVAAALQAYGATGRLGPLRSGEFSSACWVLPNPRAALEQYRNSGVTEAEVYSPRSDEVGLPLAAPDAGALVMFSLEFKSTLVPSVPGSSIDWVSDPSADPVTALLASGQYARIVERGLLELAVATSSNGRFRIIGAYSGVTFVTGVRGSAPSGSNGRGVLVADSAGKPGQPSAASGTGEMR